MFIQTESLPDASRLRFLPGRPVLADGTLELRDRAAAACSPLAQHLLDIPGVSAVVLGTDFITVTKDKGEWLDLRTVILGAIMEHFMSGAPVVTAVAARTAGAVDATGADDAEEAILEALHRVIDPELGYNIVDLGLVYGVMVEDGGAVRVAMTTTTPGCPATSYLMRGAHEAALSVAGVEAVDVSLTYEPRWSPAMMSARAKAHFGIRDEGGW